MKGIRKTFKANSVSRATLELIQKIYDADFQHVERGRVYFTKGQVLITSVGKNIGELMRKGEQFNREAVLGGIRAGLDELHSAGIAHCDLGLDNTFLLPDGRVTIGDLEFVRDSGTTAPSHLYRSDPRAVTSLDLDEIQYSVLVAAYDLLVASGGKVDRECV